MRFRRARSSAVLLVDDLEDARLALGLRRGGEQEPTDAEVRVPARLGAEARVRGLLHAVVEEAEPRRRAVRHVQGRVRGHVAVPALGQEEALLDRLPEPRRGGRLGLLAHQRERLQIEARADAGGELERALAGLGELPDALGHERADAVAHAAVADPIDVPAPAPRRGIEGDQAARVERAEELGDEERVALGLARDQRGELARGRLAGAAHGALDELFDVRRFERAEAHLAGLERAPLDLVEGDHQGVRAVDLVVAVGADEEEIAAGGVAHQERQQPERAGVGPLQIVEEEDQGVRGLGEDAEEALEDDVEPVLRLGRPERGHLGLRADQQRHLGDHVGDDAAVRAERRDELGAPRRHPLLLAGEELADELLEGLDERSVGRVVDLIELSGRERSAPLHDRPLHLVHQRRLADAGEAAHDEQLGAPSDAIERGEERGPLALSAMELLRHLEEGWDVALPRDEVGVVRAVEEAGARLEIAEEPVRALVAILGVLGEELLHHVGEPARDGWPQAIRRLRRDRDVAMHERHRIARHEGDAAGEHLVERHAQRVEVGAVIDGPVHPAGLLGGDVSEAAFEALGVSVGGHLAGEA